MARLPNKFGGGSQTNRNGLAFEQTTSLDSALKEIGYSIRDCKVFDKETIIGFSVPQNKVYSVFLEKKGVNYKDYNSKKWRPDECFINMQNRVAYIIEKKFQNTPGSVDEKLPSCHFKRQEYQKLFAPLHFKVEFLYVFNDWFLDKRYRDTLDYIEQMGCSYYFNEIPLDFLGL